jgi:hypothetical protein
MYENLDANIKFVQRLVLLFTYRGTGQPLRNSNLAAGCG